MGFLPAGAGRQIRKGHCHEKGTGGERAAGYVVVGRDF